MTCMADQEHSPPLTVMPLDLTMDFRDQGAGGVCEQQSAPAGLVRHRLRYPVRREDNEAIVRYLVELVDKNGAYRPQLLDYVAIVHDLVTNIDWRSCLLYTSRCV